MASFLASVKEGKKKLWKDNDSDYNQSSEDKL